MPADYNATARSLALPISPPRFPKDSTQPAQTSWSRQRSSQALPPNQSSAGRLRDRVVDKIQQIQRQSLDLVKRLSPLQRVAAAVAVLTALTLTILFFVFNEQIFEWLRPIAVKWKNLRGGWLILWAMTFMTAFPPLIGYSTCVTISGFIYGFPIGWFIVAAATITGSFCSFLVSRTILSGFVKRLVANDPRFAALSLVLKHDGLKLLCMIRLCPLPYSLSNGAMSTVPTVQPLTYALATAIATPKLLIHVFIGSRLAVIAESGEKMDATTKAINWASIVGGMILGALTGWLIYRRTVARSQELEAEERQNGRHATSQPEDFTDDSEAQAATATLFEDDQIDFLDYGVAGGDRYQDETNEDEDVFGIGDEEGAIGLDRQPPQR